MKNKILLSELIKLKQKKNGMIQSQIRIKTLNTMQNICKNINIKLAKLHRFYDDYYYNVIKQSNLNYSIQIQGAIGKMDLDLLKGLPNYNNSAGNYKLFKKWQLQLSNIGINIDQINEEYGKITNLNIIVNNFGKNKTYNCTNINQFKKILNTLQSNIITKSDDICKKINNYIKAI